jgi:hypothetical protein
MHFDVFFVCRWTLFACLGAVKTFKNEPNAKGFGGSQLHPLGLKAPVFVHAYIILQEKRMICKRGGSCVWQPIISSTSLRTVGHEDAPSGLQQGIPAWNPGFLVAGSTPPLLRNGHVLNEKNFVSDLTVDQFIHDSAGDENAVSAGAHS